jgi:oxygen-independent coproporphyrinogen-3 oxidase
MTGWSYHSELLTEQVPRYTSYPTVAEFSHAVGRSDMESALAGIADDQQISLCVEIPYAHEICWCCDSNPSVPNRMHQLASYLEMLETEIYLVAKLLAGRGKVRRIVFEGGNPNAMAPEQFSKLLTSLRWAFDAHEALLSIKVDPRLLTEGWLETLAAAGIERASLSVQTLDPAVQRAIGRLQPFELIEICVEDLHHAGVRSLSFDLMYGLPGQDLEKFKRTLHATAALEPDRIALFDYADVPHLVPRQRRMSGPAIPSAEQKFHQAEYGHQMLTAAGYQPIGFNYYARPDDPLAIAAERGSLHRNSQGFTDDPADVLLGLGAGATSQFPHLIVQNEKNAERYGARLSSGLLPADRGILRTDEDRRRAAIIERLLCYGKTDIGNVISQDLLKRLRPFLDLGLATLEGERLRMSDFGRPYARVVASIFDEHRPTTVGRLSRAI